MVIRKPEEKSSGFFFIKKIKKELDFFLNFCYNILINQPI